MHPLQFNLVEANPLSLDFFGAYFITIPRRVLNQAKEDFSVILQLIKVSSVFFNLKIFSLKGILELRYRSR